MVGAGVASRTHLATQLRYHPLLNIGILEVLTSKTKTKQRAQFRLFCDRTAHAHAHAHAPGTRTRTRTRTRVHAYTTFTETRIQKVKALLANDATVNKNEPRRGTPAVEAPVLPDASH